LAEFKSREKIKAMVLNGQLLLPRTLEICE